MRSFPSSSLSSSLSLSLPLCRCYILPCKRASSEEVSAQNNNNNDNNSGDGGRRARERPARVLSYLRLRKTG